MTKSHLLDSVCAFALRSVFATWLTVLVSLPQASAYERYNDGCNTCHGAFTDDTSPKGSVFSSDSKHEMHRGNGSMNTQCNLCHTNGDNHNPYIGSSDGTRDNIGVGCMGCHGREEDAGNDTGIASSPGRGAGLRQHHTNSGETSCSGCHSDANPMNYTPVGEDVKPRYYGTADTNADMSCNPVQASGTNENWTIGDFEGLDNDGDGMYDADADSDCAQNQPPVSDPNGPYSGSVGVAVNFNGSGSSDSDGTIASYSWSFGDGNSGTGVAPTHTYSAADTYTVTLTVMDDAGESDTASTTATIGAAKQPVFLPWLPLLLGE
jgi:PKD repeat protein